MISQHLKGIFLIHYNMKKISLSGLIFNNAEPTGSFFATNIFQSSHILNGPGNKYHPPHDKYFQQDSVKIVVLHPIQLSLA